jgi:metal-responsive CopG/Arc/MetJ family transcriptional regulator
MHNISQLEKQQVGLRLPKYLVEELDEFVGQYVVNRTDIITEAIKSYLAKQKEEEFYKGFNTSCKELKEVLDNPSKVAELKSFEDLIDKLDD